MPRKARRRRIRTGVGVLSAAVLFGGAGVAEAEAATLIKSDLDFVLEQIKISENHAAGGQLSGTGANQISNPLFPYGLRTVDGEMNNLLPGQKEFGAADNVFNRLVPPLFRPAEKLTFDPDGPGPAQVGDDTSYTAKKGIVEDSQPRTISNLIVDQTENNPAAVEAANQNEGSKRIDHDDRPETPNEIFLPNRAPDEGLSAPYNSWFTLFGQFFDHGLDLVTKGNSGTVFVPAQGRRPADRGRGRRGRHRGRPREPAPAQPALHGAHAGQQPARPGRHRGRQPRDARRRRERRRHPRAHEHDDLVRRPEPDLHVAPRRIRCSCASTSSTPTATPSPPAR